MLWYNKTDWEAFWIKQSSYGVSISPQLINTTEITKAIDKFGLRLITTIPEDPNIADLEVKGTPLVDLPLDSPLQSGVKEIAHKAGL